MAKTNNGFWRKAGVILGLIVLGTGIVAGFVSSNEEIGNNYKKLNDHETRIRAVETAVIEQRRDVLHIRETLDRIETKLDK